MKNIIVAAILAASTFAAPTALVATPAAAATCGVDAPAAWERPGGFCSFKNNLGSLSSPVEGGTAATPCVEPELPPFAGFSAVVFLLTADCGGGSEEPHETLV